MIEMKFTVAKCYVAILRYNFELATLETGLTPTEVSRNGAIALHFVTRINE